MIQSGAGEKKTALCIFGFFFCFYFLGLGGHIYTPDGTLMYFVTKSMVDEGKLDIPRLERWRSFGGSEVVDQKTGKPRFYTKFGLGMSLCAVPAYIAGKLVVRFVTESEENIFSIANVTMAFQGKDGAGPLKHRHPGDLQAEAEGRPTPPAPGHPLSTGETRVPVRALWYDSERSGFEGAFTAFSITWTCPFLVAAIVSMIFMVCTSLNFSASTSLIVSFLSGLASPLWHYSKEFFSEPLSALGLILFFYFAQTESKKDTPGTGWFWSGFFLGMNLLAKVANVVALLPCTILAALYLRRYSPRAVVRGGASFALGVGLWVLVLCWYNYARFGSILMTGYGDEVLRWETPFLEGLYGLLFSSGRGLFIYCPLILLSVAGFPAFARTFPREAIFIALSNVVFTVLYSKWYGWEGGWCWGPRFLFPLLPLSFIPIGCLFENFPTPPLGEPPASVLGTPPLGEPPASVLGTRSLSRLAILTIIVLSFITAFNGVIVSYNDYYNWLQKEYFLNAEEFAKQGILSEHDLVRWDWFYSPILNYWDFPVKDYFLVSRAIRLPGTILGLFGIAAIGLIISGLCLYSLSRPDKEARVI